MSKSRKFLASGIAIAVLAAVGATNFVMLEMPLRSVLHDDSRNLGITVHSYYRWGIVLSEPVFDLRGVGDENSQADVTRVLLQFAEKLKDRHYDHVVLAWRGQPRFFLPGAYFKTLGEEYSFQNPVYTFRTMPENLRKMDGSPAFGSWEGGFLGVLKGQMDDFSSFQKQWWLDSAVSEKR